LIKKRSFSNFFFASSYQKCGNTITCSAVHKPAGIPTMGVRNNFLEGQPRHFACHFQVVVRGCEVGGKISNSNCDSDLSKIPDSRLRLSEICDSDSL